MRVSNMKSANGNSIANQFIIHNDGYIYFQSYNTMIARKYGSSFTGTLEVMLNDGYWDMYSATTNKYLNQFLRTSGVAEIREKVKDGTFKVGEL